MTARFVVHHILVKVGRHLYTSAWLSCLIVQFTFYSSLQPSWTDELIVSPRLVSCWHASLACLAKDLGLIAGGDITKERVVYPYHSDDGKPYS